MTNSLCVYLDTCATTPIEDEVLAAMTHYFRDEYGNAGSHTHEYGRAAAQAVRKAREQIAAVVDASWEHVAFTSGATESNNIAILGLAERARRQGKRHVISTQIEHKAVLEPLEVLRRQDFDVTLLRPNRTGIVEARAVKEALRPDTALVSVMQVNNETGMVQPLREIADALEGHGATLHTDAAQGFGKELEALKHPRIDLISATAHKIYGPKGVAALIVRPSERTKGLAPIMFGGGQEKGLRPGTVPVPLVVGFGVAAEIAVRDHEMRRKKCLTFRRELLKALGPFMPEIHGDPERGLPHVVNLRFGMMESESIMVGLRRQVAVSNGSACTSAKIEPSHVLKAMGLTDDEALAAVRWSWCHLTPRPDWEEVGRVLKTLV